MNTPTFAESYCAKHGIAPEKFAQAVFTEALYPRARLLVGLLRFFRPNHFAADFDLIYSVEHLRRVRDFHTEVLRFNEHPANRGWLRRQLGLRVSTGRLKQLIRATLPSSGGAQQREKEGTAAPFEAEDNGALKRAPLQRA